MLISKLSSLGVMINETVQIGSQMLFHSSMHVVKSMI